MELTKEVADSLGQACSSSNESAAAFPLQQDLLSAAEYFENLRGKARLAPEKELLLAVLEDGIHCFRDNVHAQSEPKTTLREEARAWIFSNDSHRLFSFLSVCDLLDMDPEYLRQGLKHWEEHSRNLPQGQRPPRQRLVA